MKSILLALLFSAGLVNAHPVRTESIPGKVKLLIDMNVTGPSDKLDILFVIDNSGSMMEHQQNVMRSADAFIHELSKEGGDWKIGLISTSEKEAPFGGFQDEISSTTPDSVNRFIQAVGKLGINGDSFERPFASINNALMKNPRFLRASANLAIIVVSDAPEQSSLLAVEFIANLEVLGVDLNRVSLFGYLNPSEWCTPTDDTWKMAGSVYEQLSSLMNTSYSKLCDGNLGGNLVTLGAQLGKQSKMGTLIIPSVSHIPLPSAPDFDSITVTYGTQTIPGTMSTGWIYDSLKNEVVLGDQIPWALQLPQTPLEVTYVPKAWK